MTTPKYDLVISHSNCFDGMTAAWVARLELGNDAKYVFATHGDPPPDVTGKRVLIVDFAYPRPVLEAMFAESKSLLVLDHHASAEKALAGLPYAEFDMNRSGAGMAWDHFFPGQERPPIVAHAEDRDLWRFKIPGTREYHCAMTMYPMTFEAWDEINNARPTHDMIEEGSTILKFSDVLGAKFAARAGTILVAGVKFWSTNTPFEFVGEVAEALHERTDEHGKHLPVLTWTHDHTRHDWACSIRSRPDGIDVSELAILFGGGGHRHAAGFRVAEAPVGPTLLPRGNTEVLKRKLMP